METEEFYERGDSDERNAKITQLNFHMESGDTYHMYHGQDCCEQVYIEEIVGDLGSLIGLPILEAEKASNGPKEIEGGYGGEEQWTFYKLGTNRGHVNIRWYGTSNGYYSMGVSFSKNTTKEWWSDDDDDEEGA
ncbi:MAG: hypothetical protein AMJ65_14515 [Phycisphaerae bacterium SG8_4]|nr:MAG: hypothetical protein AMJ65_14515 [Phycisphaerae bacterium SG8_4]